MPSQSINELKNVSGVGPAAIEKFRDAGYETLDDLRGATLDDVTEVPGIGNATAEAILEFVAERLPEESDAGDSDEAPAAEKEQAPADEADEDESIRSAASQEDKDADTEVRTGSEVDGEANAVVEETPASGNADGTSVEELADRFSDGHFRVLALFHDPGAWLQRHDREPPNSTFVTLSEVLEHGLPELRGEEHKYDQIWRDLYDAGLVTTDSLHVMTSKGGALSRRTSALGEKILSSTNEPA